MKTFICHTCFCPCLYAHYRENGVITCMPCRNKTRTRRRVIGTIALLTILALVWATMFDPNPQHAPTNPSKPVAKTAVIT